MRTVLKQIRKATRTRDAFARGNRAIEPARLLALRFAEIRAEKREQRQIERAVQLRARASDPIVLDEPARLRVIERPRISRTIPPERMAELLERKRRRDQAKSAAFAW